MESSLSYYIPGKTFSSEHFSSTLQKHLPRNPSAPLTIFCIGTDRIAGDCLGPLVGYKLKKANLPHVRVLGTLSHPVHADNLAFFCRSLSLNSPVIAIDAALGAKEHIGWITLAKESLKPGLGVQKDLPEIGQVSITGIVGDADQNAINTLMNAPFSLIMELADCIADGIIKYCCCDIR